jgi:hypothetical protein
MIKIFNKNLISDWKKIKKHYSLSHIFFIYCWFSKYFKKNCIVIFISVTDLEIKKKNF